MICFKGKIVTYPGVIIPLRIQITHLKSKVYKEVSINYTYNNLKLQRLIQIQDETLNHMITLRTAL